MTRDAFVSDMVQWINTRLLRAGRSVTSSTPLFEDGLIDSMRILALIAWTERAIGRQIPDEHIRMDHFYNVDIIATRFLEGTT